MNMQYWNNRELTSSYLQLGLVFKFSVLFCITTLNLCRQPLSNHLPNSWYMKLQSDFWLFSSGVGEENKKRRVKIGFIRRLEITHIMSSLFHVALAFWCIVTAGVCICVDLWKQDVKQIALQLLICSVCVGAWLNVMFCYVKQKSTLILFYVG